MSETIFTHESVEELLKKTVKPCKVVAFARISELADGINRQLASKNPDVNLIYRWADEIRNQCDIVIFDSEWE